MIRKGLLVIIIFLFISGNVNSITTSSTDGSSESFEMTGPYVDNVRYSIINFDDDMVDALIDGDIDMIGTFIDPSYLAILEASEDIEVVRQSRNGYGYLTINCAKYPLDNTAFRRALAFAMNKSTISEDFWEGLSQPLDSVVPSINPFSIEGQLPYSYYDADVAFGNNLLDAAGFEIDSQTGFRTAPNGSAFDITIEVAQSSSVAIVVGAEAAAALNALHIDATSTPVDFYDYLNRLYFHGDYDIVFLGATFDDLDVDWLAYEFWSEYADEPYENFPNFANATYDSWRNQLLHSTEYEDVYEAAIEMQKILVYESPVIVCYQNHLLNAYRTDKFEGFVNDCVDGIASWWTNHKIRLKNGSIGSDFRIGIPMGVDTLNFMSSSSFYSKTITKNLHESLLLRAPDGTDMLGLAESYIIETNANLSEIPSNHMRVTFNILDNLTWSDGNPLTAEDISFTLNFYIEGSGNPYGVDLGGLVSCYAPNPLELILQFNSISYWNIRTVGYKPILPKHILSDLGADNWNAWNPDANTMVTAGHLFYNGTSNRVLSACPRYYRINAASAPTIIQPENVTYFVGSDNKWITWKTSDLDPRNYTLFLDGNLIGIGVWDARSFAVELEGLSEGYYNYTVILTDRLNQNATSSVYVTALYDDGPPEVNQPENVTFTSGETGNWIIWTLNDSNPYQYEVHLDDNLIKEGKWNTTGDTVSICVDNYTVGEHTLSISARDLADNVAVSTVTVTVTAPFDIMTLGMIGGVAGIVVVIIVGGLVVKKR